MQLLAEKLLEELMEAFPLGYTPEIQWKGLRVSAGIAYFKVGRIALSRTVLKNEAMVRDTLIHEYAHLLSYVRHGRAGAGHGRGWQQAMRDLGAEPKVHHTYEVERNMARQQVTYLCKKCGAKIIRSRRLAKNRVYVHARCGGTIRLHQVQAVTESKPAS
ncbi:MAG: SprT-like domain-containing protein [Fimbriimonas sp.]